MKRIWHYTNGQAMREILREGKLRLATAFVPVDERPALWFSTNPVWEPTAIKMWGNQHGFRSLTKEETAGKCEGLYRIEVAPESAPYTIHEFRKRSGISNAMWKGLLLASAKKGALVSEWRVSFEPVPASKWLCIERWNEGTWCSISIEECARFLNGGGTPGMR